MLSPRASRSPRPRRVSRCAITSSSRRSRTARLRPRRRRRLRARHVDRAGRRAGCGGRSRPETAQEGVGQVQRPRRHARLPRSRHAQPAQAPPAVPRRGEGAAPPCSRRPAAVRLVEQAREAAWGDVEANLQRRLKVEGMRADLDPDYEMMRAARMQSLRLVDLPRLASNSAARLRTKLRRGPPTGTCRTRDSTPGAVRSARGHCGKPYRLLWSFGRGERAWGAVSTLASARPDRSSQTQQIGQEQS